MSTPSSRIPSMRKRIIDERLMRRKTEHELKKSAAHAKLRFLQRFNYPLTDEELQEIEQLLFSGHGTLVDWAHGEPGVYEMKWRDFEFYAVFEYKTFKVVTFLTKEMRFRDSIDNF